MSEQLIEVVHQQKLLSDAKCEYTNYQSDQNAAWEEAAGTLNDSVENCKEKWTKFRSAVASAIKRRRTKKIEHDAVNSPWLHNMRFVLPSMELRNSKRNTSDMTNNDFYSPADSPSSTRSNKSCRSQYTTSSKRTNKSQLKDLQEFVNPYNDLKQQKQSLMQDIDEIDLFFLSMSSTVKALPKLDQAKIKLDLHSAVSQAEIRQMEDSQNIITSPLPDQQSMQSHIHPSTYVELTTHDQLQCSNYIESTHDQPTVYMHPHPCILQPISSSQNNDSISSDLKTLYSNTNLYCSKTDC